MTIAIFKTLLSELSIRILREILQSRLCKSTLLKKSRCLSDLKIRLLRLIRIF